MGSRRIFTPQFKLQVLDSYRKDADCRGNQRATARKYGIHRRQIQKWLQAEAALRTTVEAPALNLAEATRLPGDARRSQPQHQHRLCGSEPPPRSRPTRENASVSCNVSVSLFPSVRIEVLRPPLDEEDHDQELEDDADQEEDEDSDGRDSDQALDFTCAALSKRRSFSLQFKLQVLDAFHADAACQGNQRATARKFSINRRQVQKWLGQEAELRAEAAYRGGLYRQRLDRARTPSSCPPAISTSPKRKLNEDEVDVEEPVKRLCVVEDPVQETALCLVKPRKTSTPELLPATPPPPPLPSVPPLYLPHHYTPFYIPPLQMIYPQQDYLYPYQLPKWLKQDDRFMHMYR